jgi:hypothetical protein
MAGPVPGWNRMHLQDVSVGLLEQIRKVPFVQPDRQYSEDELDRPDSGSDCTYPDFVTCVFLLRTIEIELQLTEVQAVRFRVLDKSSRFTNDGHGSQIVFNEWARVRLNAQCKGDRLF